MQTTAEAATIQSARIRAAAPRAVMLSVVVPVFNEQETLPELHRRLSETLQHLGIESEIVFVNDGSRDRTAALLAEYAECDETIRVLEFSRNFGHQAAITAGLEHAQGEAVAVLDGDLQDPPEVLPALLERWREGFDVAYAVRTQRKEGWAKRLGYFAFYRFFRAVANLDIPLDTGDFCLLDRRAVDALNRLPERDRFVRGLRSYVGFRQVGVPYERQARFAGQPKYSFRQLAALGVNGLFNFSAAPVRALGGLSCSLLAIAFAIGCLLSGRWAFWGIEPPGWAIVVAVLFGLAGLQLGGTGLLGIYLLKIFTEVKRRPSYILAEGTPLARRREG